MASIRKHNRRRRAIALKRRGLYWLRVWPYWLTWDD